MFIIITLGTLAAIGHIQQMRGREEQETASKIRATIDDYLNSKKVIADTWWTEQRFTSPTAVIDEFMRKQVQVRDIIQSNSAICPLTERIAKRFPEIILTVFLQGKPQEIGPIGVDAKHSRQALTICFLPRDVSQESHIVMPTWNCDLNAIVIPGIEIPPALYTAVIAHECGHALLHNKLDGRKDDPQGSDANTIEEVEMHELGGKVLNELSHGAYDKRIDEIVHRLPNETRFDHVLATMTREDFLAFDTMFGCNDTVVPSNMLITQCALKVCLHFCDVHGLGVKEKIAVYHWFDENIFRTPSP